MYQLLKIVCIPLSSSYLIISCWQLDIATLATMEVFTSHTLNTTIQEQLVFKLFSAHTGYGVAILYGLVRENLTDKITFDLERVREGDIWVSGQEHSRQREQPEQSPEAGCGWHALEKKEKETSVADADLEAVGSRTKGAK